MLARDARSFAAIAGGLLPIGRHPEVIESSYRGRCACCSAASASPTDRMPRVMALAEHTTKAFDYDLQDLARMIAEMGGLAERQIVEVIEALTRRDIERARRSVAADAAIDALQRSIEERAVETIARRQPMAIDLRGVVGVMRISNDLEPIGYLAN